VYTTDTVRIEKILSFFNRCTFLFQLSDAAMAPNHQVSLSPEIPDTSEDAVAQTEESVKSPILSAEATIQPPKTRPSLKELNLHYKWTNIIAISIFHVVASYGYIVTATQGYWATYFWSESFVAVYNFIFVC
jgi:hypothetical protein